MDGAERVVHIPAEELMTRGHAALVVTTAP
jgi:hypothetical protein